MLQLSTFITISGDFNHATLAATLPILNWFVECPTMGIKTVREAYSSIAHPPLITTWFTFYYCKGVWSQGANEDPQSFFKAIYWDVHHDSLWEEIDGLTDCITGYSSVWIMFFSNRISMLFPHNKPWVTSDISSLLNKKKRQGQCGDETGAVRSWCEGYGKAKIGVKGHQHNCLWRVPKTCSSQLYSSISSTWAWVWRGSLFCRRHPSWFPYPRRCAPVWLTTIDLCHLTIS